MTRTISMITTIAGLALLAAAPIASGQSSPGELERAVAALENGSPVRPDALEQAAAADLSTSAVPTDAHQRTVPSTEPASPSLSSSRSSGTAALDHNARMDAPVPSRELAVQESGSEIAWAEVAIGFLLGIVLALGLYAGTRFTSVRGLAT